MILQNKKGLSTVVTTLIIILLVLVAIGIIWVVVRGVIDTGAQQIEASTDCPLVDLKVTGVSSTCTAAGGCTVDVVRGAGGVPIDGVYITFDDGSTQAYYYYEQDVPQLTNKGIAIATGTTNVSAATPTTVRVAPYFKDTEGIKKLCPNYHEINL